MKRLSFKTGISKLKLVFVRFPFTIMFIIGLSVLCFLSVQKVNVDIHESLWSFFVLGILLNVPVTLFLEEFKKVSLRILFNLFSTILLAFYCFLLPDKLFAYHYFQMVALGIVFVLSAFYISFIKKNSDIPFWDFSRESIIQLFISGVFSLILYGGLGLAILSLDKLFNIDIDKKVYTNLAVVCFVIFAPMYFLSNVRDEIEKRRQEFSFHKIIKIFGLYILLPILAAYILILYVYLFQIIIKWELPNGWVSTLVSVLGLGGFSGIFILYPLRLKDENKVVNLFSRYFSLLLMPLLVLMSIGIFRRFGDYGLTINRLYIMILNVWLYGICIYLFISRAQHLKWIVISFSVVLLLSSMGPWSVFNITKRTMLKEIELLMDDAKLLKNGKVIDNYENKIQINLKIAEPLNRKVSYICSNFGSKTLQPFFNDSIDKLSGRKINERLGIESAVLEKTTQNSKYFNFNITNNNRQVDLNSYKMMLYLKTNQKGESVFENAEFKVNLTDNFIQVYKTGDSNAYISIDLKSKLRDQIKLTRNDEFENCKEFILSGENYQLIVSNISGNYNFKNNSIVIKYFEANLFLK